MSFKKKEYKDDFEGGYALQEDTKGQNSGRIDNTKEMMKPIAYPEDEEDQNYKRYNTDFITYKTIRSEMTQENWCTVVKILSIALVIYASLTFLFDLVALFYRLFLQDSKSKNYEFMDQETLVFIGVDDSAFRCASLVSDVYSQIYGFSKSILIFIQGYYGLVTVGLKTRAAIRRLITITIAFMVAHIVLVILKLIISASYIDNCNWREAGEDLSEEEIQKMETFVYGLIIATFFLSCVIVSFC